MKHSKRSLLLSLLLCLLLLLGGCREEPAVRTEPSLPPTTEQTETVTETQEVFDRSWSAEESPEPGPGVCFNGGEALQSLRLEGGLLFPAELLAELGSGSAETETDESGRPVLVLQAWGRSLRCPAELTEVRLDGEPLTLDRPALLREGRWYLPLEPVAEALGCALYPLEAGERLALLRPEEGPSLWFGGVPLGPVAELGQTPCFPLSTLAEAVGGTLSEAEDALTLTTENHALTLRPGTAVLEADGAEASLPLPLMQWEGEWLVSLRPLAEALELTEQEDALGLVFSAIEPRQTKLWIDGTQVSSYGLPGSPLLLRLQDAGPLELTPDESWESVELRFRDRSVTLRAGERLLWAGEEELPLSAPVCADGSDWYAPASELLQALGLTELRDPELPQRYYTHIVTHDSLAEGYRIPVFMHHAVSDYLWGIPELFASPATLETQLQAIIEGGYTPITFEDLDRIEQIEKPIMLTFDDGYDDNYTELFPLLKKYNVKATIFIIVDDLGKNHKLTKAQVKELSDSGLVSIQSHTMSHNYLSEMYPDRLKHEHYDSMLELARITGKQPFVLCYPTGKNTWASRQYTAEYYEYGLCMGGPCWVTGTDPYLIYRYYVPRNLSLETFKSYLG